MTVTSEVRDGKLYVLCFESLAHFLVHNSKYKVLFLQFNNPAIVVSPSNFEYCANRQEIGSFVYELELPLLEVNVIENHDGLKLNVNSNPKYTSYFTCHDFDEADVWREKEIERRLKKAGSYQQLDKVREEVDQLIESLPL